MRATIALSALLALAAARCQPGLAPNSTHSALQDPAAPVAQATPASPSALALSPDAQSIYRNALVRDGAPSCAELSRAVSDPLPALIEVAERVQHPPSAAMRAAQCVVREHSSRAVETIGRWVSRRATMGLGLMALNHLDAMDERTATRVVELALRGEIAAEARSRIERSERHPALRARATSASP